MMSMPVGTYAWHTTCLTFSLLSQFRFLQLWKGKFKMSLMAVFVAAEFSLTVCSWRTQCLSGPQGWSKSFFLYNMLILLIVLEVKSFSVDFIVGLYSWAWDDFQSSAWEDKIICLSKSIEPRRWKERLAKVFSKQIHTGIAVFILET